MSLTFKSYHIPRNNRHCYQIHCRIYFRFKSSNGNDIIEIL